MSIGDAPEVKACKASGDQDFATQMLEIYVGEILRRLRTYDEPEAFALLWKMLFKDQTEFRKPISGRKY